jgi:uncharacterized protein (DUF934 family)
MPTLRDRTGTVPNEWVRVETAGDLPDGARVILPWSADLKLPDLPDRMLGLHLKNDTDPAQVAPLFSKVALISVAFPAFSDGRGFSIARRLRALGFRGRLRAAGPVIADQFDYLLACGFDEVETPEKLEARQPQPQWEKALGAVTLAYQRGYPGRASILEARRAARGAP